MENNWILTPDLYLAMSGLFAAVMVVRELAHGLRLRRARIDLRSIRRYSATVHQTIDLGTTAK